MSTNHGYSAPTPRPELLQIPAAIHGALDYAELANQCLTADGVIDFSENSNPFGPSSAVRAALATIDPARYPDRECLALRHTLAEQIGASPAEIVVGNGATEILWLVAFAFLTRGDRVLILGPTFGEYGRMAQLMGAQVVEWRTDENTDFTVDPDTLAQQINIVQPKVIFLCNPNNPTGTIIDPAVIAMWARMQPQTLFVVDEAYLAFGPGLCSIYAWRLPNVLIVRSLTKEYALAGLRLGYALGPTSLAAGLVQVRVPWSVNAAAQAAGVAALLDQEHLQRTLTALQTAKAELVAELEALELLALPSQTHYFLIRVGDGAHFRQQLFNYRLLVRDCASFGLPAHVRIATRRPEDNQKFLSYLKEHGTL